MRKRARLRRKRRRLVSIGTKFVMFIIVFMVCLIGALMFASQKITPGLMEYAELEARKLATILMNSAVTSNVLEKLDVESLFVMTKDSDGSIRSVDFNPVTVNSLLIQTTNNVQKNLKRIEKGDVDALELIDNSLLGYNEDQLRKGIIGNIPTGVLFHNALLANLGPKFPVRIKLIGDIESNVHTKVTNYGINNAVIEVSIHMEIKTQALLPFSSKSLLITSDIPVAVKLMQGSIPTYYFGGKENSSIFTLPTE